MIKLDFVKMLLDKRMSKHELAELCLLPYSTVNEIVNRGTVKVVTLRKIEEKIGGLNSYIIK